MIIPFIGYAPDLDPQTDGVIVDCDGIVPTESGMAAAPSLVNAGYSVFPSSIRGLAIVRFLDGSRYAYAGTSAKLYDLVAGVTTDRSKVGGYALGTNDRWTFAQFGNTTIAAAKTETLQFAATSGSTFADITGAPKARYVTTAAGFVMVAATNDATFGDQSDRWWCSAYQDYTSWTPSIATQAASGRLIDTPGQITALQSLGDNVVVYKERGMWIGSYVGGDTIWQFTRLPGDIGAMSNESVVSTGYSHFFVSTDDFYMFDGTRAVSIGSPIRKTFFRDLSQQFGNSIIGAYDRINGLVWWFYASTASAAGEIDSAVIYHIKTGKWGAKKLRIEYAATYVTDGTSYNGLGNLYTNYDDLPATIPYDSDYWTPSFPTILVADTAHKLYTLSGAADSAWMVTGTYGDDQQLSTVTGVVPRFKTAPQSSTLTPQTDYEYGDSFDDGQETSLVAGKYDLLSTTRFHRFRMAFTGAMEIIGIKVNATVAGMR